MGKVFLLARREVGSYFTSPIAYVAMAVFVFVAGCIFVLWDFQPGQPAQMHTTFSAMFIVLIICLPLVTMRALADEKATGTIETLLTAPITDTQVVLAKFLGCAAFFLAMLAPTLLLVGVMRLYGNPEYGPIASAYLGLIFLGMLYIAIGLMTSAMTRVQLIAAVLAILPLLVLWLMESAAGVVPPQYGNILRQASTSAHYSDFTLGVVDVVHVIYFVALTAYALFFTVKILESRRWR
jgi:ABC-2 type transport system permease protein